MDEYLNFAKEFALEAGSIIRQNFTLGMHKTWKEDKTPVTETDEIINKNLIEQVKAKFPNFAVQGEEENLELPDAEMTWVCDPVDGTFPFSHGIPIATFSLALVDKNGKPKIGVVCDPFTDRLIFACVGEGVYINGRPVKVTDRDTLADSIIDICVWANRIDVPNRHLREDLLSHEAMPLSYCSVVFSCYLVAAGEIDGVVFNVSKPEDIAAIKVIVEEAGGKVTDLQGKEQSYLRQTNGAIISNGVIHEALVDIVNKNN